jgi:hypothetical protein
MAEKGSEREPSKQGEMRRRWRVFLEDGSLAALGSEGRLVASYVQYWADFQTCEVRFSMRYVAKYLKVQATTVRRGISQMVDCGILSVVDGSTKSGRTRYVVQERQEDGSVVRTLRAQGCAQGVRTPDTLRAQGAHATCAERAHHVRRVRTLGAHNSFLSIGSPKRTNGESSEATPVAGQGPAPASLPDNAGSGGPSGDVA